MKIIKKIFDLLNLVKNKQYFILFTLILFAAFLDILGVASIFPFVSILVNPQLVETNNVFAYFYKKLTLLGVSSPEQFTFIIGIITFILLISSSVFRILTNYHQINFILKLEISISKYLIQNYLYRPYTWFLKKNSADLGRNILAEVSHVVGGTLMPTLVIFSQSIVIFLLFVLLFFSNFIITIFVGLVFGSSYFCIFYFTKNFLNRVGNERLKSNKERFMEVGEAFNAIKEIKFKGLEQTYINRFLKPMQSYVRSQFLFEGTASIPRFVIEAIAFGGMIILILVLISRNISMISIIPYVALYTFAGYRLMPALQQVYMSLSQLRFIAPNLDALHKDLMSSKFTENLKIREQGIMQINKFIKLKNISYNYPDAKKISLQNISITIPIFSKVGIIGPSGSGKTTLVDIILGLLDADSGTVSVDDKILTNKNKIFLQNSIGYVPQQIYLNDNSVSANIAFGVDVKDIDREALENAAKIANLHNFITQELPSGYDTVVGERGATLSGGQRQRIGIARALYTKPQILILDEATNALDNLTEQVIMEAVENLKRKITVIIISHRLNIVKNCDIIFLLDKGQLIAQGTYSELVQSNKIFEQMSKIS
jgi:ABC-type multidrug transport system fused ATPase/permease subunit